MVDIRCPHRIVAAAAVATGALAVACTASTTTRTGPTQDAPRPTVVLVHGAFADGASRTTSSRFRQPSGRIRESPMSPRRSG
ncbi:hypothetical protein ACWGMO_22555 [Nocardia salmonicida]